MTSNVGYYNTGALPGAPPQYPGQQPIPSQPDLTHGPKVEFYHRLKINWKFGLSDYVLVQRPMAPTAPAIYRFATPSDDTRKMLHNWLFGATQGLSKNVYKVYTITVIFKDTSHQDALEYCQNHKTSTHLISMLSGQTTHEVRGSQLEPELANWANLFKHVLFGVCSGMLESQYLLVLSKTPIDTAEFAAIAHEMETTCAKSDFEAGNYKDKAKDTMRHIARKVVSHHGYSGVG